MAETLADRLADYCETFRTEQGHGAGEPFRLLPWQREFLAGAFGDGVTEAALTVGRGNGKSALLGAILAACVDPDGPLHSPRAVNLVVAASLAQATETGKHAQWFLAQKYDLKRRTEWSSIDSASRFEIQHRATGARLRALSANPRTAHGLGAFSLCLCDEGAQWEPTKADAMFAALSTSQGKQEGSRLVAIGTRPADPSHWFTDLLDRPAPGRYQRSYGLPPDTDDGDALRREFWLRANPSAAHWPVLDAAVRADALKAAKEPRRMASFRALRCNMGTADTRREHLIDAGEWVRIEPPPPAVGPALWGVDLGHSRSASAIVAAWPNGRAEALAALPAVPSLADRERADRAPEGLYAEALATGGLIVSGIRSPDVRALISAALARWGGPAAVAADRWRIGELQDAFEALGAFPPITSRGMGWRDGGADVDAFKYLTGEGRWLPVRTRYWDWSMGRAITVSNPVGAHKLEKRAGDDLAVASTLAAGMLRREGDALAAPPPADEGFVDL